MLYFHIPFCRQKCSYCNFHFSTSLALADEMQEAMKRELYLRKDEQFFSKLESVYFGGGTPSFVGSDKIADLLNEISKIYDFDNLTEITLEANPEDLTKEFLKNLKKIGVNRLSVGVQSFWDDDLRLMNRNHTAVESLESIKRAQDSGFENISIDLIYGSPVSGYETWQKNVEIAVNLEVSHISSYALTPEPKTALENWIRHKKISAPDENLQSEEFDFLSNYLRDNGFLHYEISNFAKNGKFSKHNTAYWQGKNYLGIGPSAHSYDGKSRRSWNFANNSKYIKEISQNILPSESENLTISESINEKIMTGLRTMWGFDMDNFKEIPEVFREKFYKNLQLKLDQNLLILDNNFLKIPYEKWFLADGIASDLFLTENF